MGGSQYSRVCGRALACRFGWNYAFWRYHLRRQGIDGQYVDGLSLPHGAPGSRQHIWTFASGLFTGRSNIAHRQILNVHVTMGTLIPHLLLWAMTIFVRVLEAVGQVSSIQMLHSGMVMFVKVVAHAASSTIHHGSPRTFKGAGQHEY